MALFRHCLVKVWHDDYLETIFEGGGRCPALFTYDKESELLAERLGYVSARRMHREHDLAHTMLAEAMGLPWSPVLYHGAGGPEVSPADRTLEEGRVLAFQRYLNTGDYDPLLDVLPNLEQVAKQFREKMQEIWRD